MEILREQRQLRMHTRLLMDVIKKQAGTLAKAILEGVMNSVDAGATKCDIALTDTQLTICDDGKGITDRGQIERFFETFGQPHEAAEGKRYGAFRMGRGQLFAYGSNIWMTGPFEMQVDVNRTGLQYELTTHQAATDGCKIIIQLYGELLPSELAETERTLRQWARYAPCQVTWNGELFSVNPDDEIWSEVTEDAYVRINSTQQLSVYNLGVHVLDFAQFRLGCGGVVVSKRRLDVNFARNDIVSTCPVWKRIRRSVDARAVQRNLGKTTLNDGGRQRLADQWARREVTSASIADAKILTAVTGRNYSFRDVVGYKAADYNHKIACGPRGSRLGDAAMSQKLAFVLADETLARFECCDLPKFLRMLERFHRETAPGSPFALTAVDLAALRGELGSEETELISAADFTPREKVWHDLLVYGMSRLRTGASSGRRRFVIGAADAYMAWTDASSYVALSRKYLAEQKFDVAGFVNVGLTLLDQLCYDASSLGDVVRSPEFFELYYAETANLAEFVKYARQRLPMAIKRAGLRAGDEVLRDADKDASASRALQRA